MANKITISSNEKKVMGTIKRTLVRPFGDSAHVIMSKKDIGKMVDIVIPEDEKGSVLLYNIKEEKTK